MHFFQNLSVKTKLFALVGIFVVGLVALAAFSYSTMNVVKVNGPYYKQIVQGKDLIADILPPPEYIIEAYLVVLQMVDETDSAKLQQLVEKSKTLRTDYEGRHEFWAKDLSDGPLKEALLVKSYRPAMEFFNIRDREFTPLVLQGEREKAKELAQGALKQQYEVHRAVIDEIVPMTAKRNTDDERSAADTIASSTFNLIGLGLGVIVLSSLCGWVVGRGIVRPLEQTVLALQDIAQGEGDLTQRVTVASQDEVGQLGVWFNTFVAKIQQTVSVIGHTTHTLASASEELTAVNQQMATNAEETANQAAVVSGASELVNSNIQSVAAATEEMSVAVKEIAQNAAEAARVATQAVQVAELTNTTILKLGQSSGEIGQVLKVITSIAEQTNLLALNATIEAARAGEAGKGFAVVANEVKELAKQTAQATEDISNKITAIQGDSQGAVAAIEQISTIIGQVNDIASTIASAVEEQSVTTAEMARNVEEASKGSAEIAQNIARVAETAQGTASGTTQTQAATQELTRMAVELQQLVGQFKYDEAAPGSITQPKKMPVGVRPMVNGHVHDSAQF